MRSLIEGLAGAAARSTPSDRSRAANREDGAYVAAANENTATATAAKIMIGTNSISSDLNLNDPSNYKISDRLQHDPCSEQRMADGIVKQRADETRIHNQHGHNDGWRKAHQQHHSEPPLRGVNPHLTQYLEALTDHVGQIVQNFRQVATGFTLQHDRGDEKLHIHKRYAF